MEMQVLVFDVDFPGEPEAGLTAHRDSVAVIFEYGGEETEGAFSEYMRGCLCDWYPGARVELREEGVTK
jgi:hypothetical protein